MCPKCYSAMQNIVCIGNPVEAQCEYCGRKFILGKPYLCLNCIYFYDIKTEDGYRYYCHNEDGNYNEELNTCSNYINENDMFEEGE